MYKSLIRQQDILPPEKLAKLAVTIIGCGAVGSFVALTLAKMGITNITVYDGDTVAAHNLPNQWYKADHIGMNKTDALWDIINDFTGVELKANDYHYERETLRGIVICCVDSMDTRLNIWREVKKFNPELYIDARMGAEVGKVLVPDVKSFSQLTTIRSAVVRGTITSSKHTSISRGRKSPTDEGALAPGIIADAA